jgi:phospholipid/cholesterol/gamma-HCH transport system ATP-binding protein
MNKNPSSPLVELENVEVKFGETVVHKNISLKLHSGEVVTILGPSGTGKTVLLKLIIGLLSPTKGKVKVMGQDLEEMNEDQIRELRKNIGMLFQGAALFDSISVYDNVAFSLREFAVEENKISATVHEKLAWVDLEDKIDQFPPELSGGQKKRVGLARTLATEPKIVLFDEPTTGLDPTSRSSIDKLIIRLRDEVGITSVVVTHDIESAKQVSDRLILLSDGEVAVDGKAADLWQNNELIRSFAEGNWKET